MTEAMVNSALTALNVRREAFQSAYLRSMQKLGEARGNTPEEIAFYLASRLPLTQRSNLDVETVRQWIRAGRVNTERGEVREALTTFAMWDEMSAR